MDKNKLTRAEKIVKEIDEFLKSMTEEERKIFLKKMGFKFAENNQNERNQQLINLLTALKAVLLQKQQEKHITFEDTKAMIDFMKSKPKVTLKGTRHIPTQNEIEAMQKANERIKEGNLRELEAKASTEKEGIVYCSLPCEQTIQESVEQLIKEGPKL